MLAIVLLSDDCGRCEDKPEDRVTSSLAGLLYPKRNAAPLREQGPHVQTPLPPPGCILKLITQPQPKAIRKDKNASCLSLSYPI